MTAKLAAVQKDKSITRLTVTFVCKNQKKESKYYILLSDDADGLPCTGEVLCDEDLRRIELEAARADAYKRVLNILSYGDNSVFALKKKLSAKGVSRENVDFAVDRARTAGYIREDSQLDRAVVRLFVEKHFGSLRIAKKLSADGYRICDISAAMKRKKESGEIDFDTEKEKIINRFTDENGITDRVSLEKELRKLGYIR